jgi:heptosyltransferase-2
MGNRDTEGTGVEGRLAQPLRGLARIPEPRITVVRAGGLGDTLLLLPALQWLRSRLPAARLTLVGSEWAEALRPLLTFPLDVVRFDAAGLAPLFAEASPREVPPVFSRADALILYTAQARSAFARHAARACPGPCVVWGVVPAPGRHAALHFLAPLAARLPRAADVPAPALRAPPEIEEGARAWLAAHLGADASPTAVHPGSGGGRKCWPPERFAVLAARLGTPVVLIEGPADRDACEAVRCGLPAGRPPLAEARALPLPELAAVLGRCAAYVGNDSGISHLAAALGLPTVAVFGPTDAAVWAPLGPRARVVAPAHGLAWPDLDRVLAELALARARP